MLEGICPVCGLHCYGWALNTRRNQVCVKCGSVLDIRNNGVAIPSQIPPFKLEEYNLSRDQGNWTNPPDSDQRFYLKRN